MEVALLGRILIVIGAVLAAWGALWLVLRSMRRARAGSKGFSREASRDVRS